MIILPAIDLKNQKAIRLIQGDFKQETVYSNDPIALAKSFELSGAKYLHIVDLDGAKVGDMLNLNIIKDIVDQTSLKIEVGGGIRSLDRIEKLLSYGVSEVIVGSVAVEDEALLAKMIKTYPNKIIVSIDAKNGYVLTRGWQKDSQIKVIEFAKKLEELGIKKIVYTDVSKDGMLEGPSFEHYEQLLKETKLKVIASGGVSSIDDLKRLNRMSLYGAIVGKAIYEKKVDLKEAISCLQKESFHV